ncbi:MAG: glutamate-1-semialdehyde 2,1-aminomutase [Terriglobales bacterium]
MKLDRSIELQQQAEHVLPGGVDSPVRAFRAVGGTPRWIERGDGAYLWDADGNRYLDLIGSWGAMLLGHADPQVTAAVRAAAAAGSSFGLSTPAELALGRQVVAANPQVEMIRFVNSGTEATMSALRLARGFTGREGVIKFAGGYHGHADLLLAQAGSGVATLGLASCAGVAAGAVAATFVLPFNDIAAAEAAFAQRGAEIAAVIVEPVAGNMGCVPPAPGFLAALRRLTAAAGAVLILDEVMTGFRLAYGGATERLQLEADLWTYGKILGGGLPIGAYGGRAEIMRQVSPLGPVYQAGTLAGNPLAMAAGLATLDRLQQDPDGYARAERWTGDFAAGLNDQARRAGVPLTVQAVGSMFTPFFTARPVGDFAAAQACDTHSFAAFHRALLAQGVLLPPAQFEAAFVSWRHGPAELELALRAAQKALAALRG